MARIIIITAHSSTLVRFRGNLIREWNDRGHEVVAVGPEVNYERELADLEHRMYVSRLIRLVLIN